MDKVKLNEGTREEADARYAMQKKANETLLELACGRDLLGEELPGPGPDKWSENMRRLAFSLSGLRKTFREAEQNKDASHVELTAVFEGIVKEAEKTIEATGVKPLLDAQTEEWRNEL